MNALTQIPEGFRQDSKGRLVPESSIKAIDFERDALVSRLIGKVKEVQQQLKQFKALEFGDIAAFIDLSLEQYGSSRRK